jgi:hypothetical protein
VSTQDGTEYTTTRTEIELHDAKDATIQLARIRGLYVDRHELTGKDGGPVDLVVTRRVVHAKTSRVTEHLAANGAGGNGSRP